MATTVAFKQVDVFTSSSYNGNPLAVILDARNLSDAEMQSIARWTHLSETTFILPPSHPEADYQVRIFTPDTELPFAGHPTLGSAHALRESGLTPKRQGIIIQQCELGLVTLHEEPDGALAFAAPQAILTPFADHALVRQALGSNALHGELPVMAADMGIRWLLVPLISADAVLALTPDTAAFAQLVTAAGVDGVMPFGPLSQGSEKYEVRGLLIEGGSLTEDPVTGSANACLARYLAERGEQVDYRVRQGTALHRAGRLSVSWREGTPWIGGQSVTVIDGTIRMPASAR